MQHLTRNIVLIGIMLTLCVLSIIPPKEKLRLGKDLAGGVSLVYTVALSPEDSPAVIDRVIEVLKERVDPQGVMEISFVRQGRDRIEITMPLPSAEVRQLRAKLDEQLARLEDYRVDTAAFELAMRESGEARTEALRRLMDTPGRTALLQPVLDASLAAAEARARYEAALAAGTTSEDELNRLIGEAGAAEQALETARQGVLAATVSPEDMLTALELSERGPKLKNPSTGRIEELPSPRSKAIESIRARIGLLPGADEVIDDILQAHAEYSKKRRGLDDPTDLQRLLQGAGVLEFRIAVQPGSMGDEERLRRELRERGPEGVQSTVARWYAINKPEEWAQNTEQFRSLLENPSAYLASLYNLVAEERDGVIYVLLHDEPGLRITRADGDWSLQDAFPTQDELGRPAIGFRMDPRGALLMGKLTEQHRGRQMAIVLDDQVYSAPSINNRITDRGIIQGTFSQEELNYLIKTLAAGSLQAKLSPRPISISTVAPELGADNLQKGMKAAVIALVAICAFMVCYYFLSGAVAVIALVCNCIILLGAMSLSNAAFTLPGIAGIILTFGTAVDANVLIYERIREELNAGRDLRAAVRNAFQRVLSTIVDANLTNLIVCFVLVFVGTQEIKGFGVTLGIGVVATMICALTVTRLIFVILADKIRVKELRQLPLVWPALQRALTPKVDWIGLRVVFIPLSFLLLGLGITMCFVQGEEMLDTEFRGGTAITLRLKEVEQPDGTNKRLMLERQEVAARIASIAETARARVESGQGTEDDRILAQLRDAEVVVVNPTGNGYTSDTFKIKAPILKQEGGDTEAAPQDAVLLKAILNAFQNEVESRPALTFRGSDATTIDGAPVYRIVESSLGANIAKPDIQNDVGPFVGGVAILLEAIQPPVTEDVLRSRLEYIRSQADFAADALKRSFQVIPLSLTANGEVESAAIVARDPVINIYDDTKWKHELAASEWEMTRAALTVPTTLAGVESFSAAVAASFRARAIISILLSFVLVTIYVWVRFGSLRYSLAAIRPLVFDVLTTIGFIAITEYVFDVAPWLAQIGIRPFKFDLGLLAAVLTIIGYSLNDTIVILDRIRENRGKLAYASKKVINDSVNQTMSRTFITAGLALLALLVLFIWGGDGVKSFSYAMIIGTIVGTFSTIAISAPMVYTRRIPASALPAAAGSRVDEQTTNALTTTS